MVLPNGLTRVSPAALNSPGFRCEWGAETYAAFRSVVSTAKANRASVLDVLRFVLAAQSPAQLVAEAR